MRRRDWNQGKGTHMYNIVRSQGMKFPFHRPSFSSSSFAMLPIIFTSHLCLHTPTWFSFSFLSSKYIHIYIAFEEEVDSNITWHHLRECEKKKMVL